MNLCFDGHEEVYYETKKCPVCEEMEKSSNFEDKIYDLKEQITKLESEKE